MSVSKERFEQGMTYEGYKAQMTRNRDRFDAAEAAVVLAPEELAYFTGLPQPLDVLVLAEDWCGDVIANLPILGRLAEESGKLNLRVFLRDQNLDIMDQYLKDGQFRAIPTFIFFDAEFNEIGHWIERPASVSELQAQMRRKLFATEPALAGIAPDTPLGQLPEAARDRVMQAFTAFREEHRHFSNSEVVREIRALIEHGQTQAQESPQPVNAANGIPKASAPAANGIKVSITYCAECGYQPQTLALTSALMDAFLHEVTAIELLPWRDGAFEVVVNGEMIHSMYRDGGFPEHETIIGAVRKLIA
ncbi:MAG: SelT/SelW/SelH family protein [Caldilineaceae bacterium]|nr:SelT/SelW/SelH family protein [Caldilineaceae bacterium]